MSFIYKIYIHHYHINANKKRCYPKPNSYTNTLI